MAGYKNITDEEVSISMDASYTVTTLHCNHAGGTPVNSYEIMRHKQCNGGEDSNRQMSMSAVARKTNFLKLLILILLAGAMVLATFFYMQHQDLNHKKKTIAKLEKIIKDLKSRTYYADNSPKTSDVSQIDGGGWTLVRHAPAGNIWHKATDQLNGTDVYGTPCGETCNKEWSIKFVNSTFKQFLIITGDRKKWLIASKEEVIGSFYDNIPRLIDKSSTNTSSYKCKWYRREGHKGDPWITLDDYHSAILKPDVLYGEDHYYSGPDLSNILSVHEGANVFIR